MIQLHIMDKIFRCAAVVGIFIGACGLIYKHHSMKDLAILLIVLLGFGILFLIRNKILLSKRSIAIFIFIIVAIVQLINGISLASNNHSWDAGAIQHIAEDYIKTGSTDPNPNSWEYNYLLRYGNNIHITYFVVSIYRLADFLHIDRNVLLIFINNILILLTSYFIIFIAYKKNNNRIFVLTSLISIFLINLSPYSTVFYTDTLGMFLLALQILLLYVMSVIKYDESHKLRLFLITVLGSLFYIGYIIKPTTILVVAAVIFYNLLFKLKKENIHNIIMSSVLFLTGLIVSYLAVNCIISLSPGFAKYSKDQIKDRRAGAIHYLGMGAMRGLPPYTECNTGAYCSRYADDTAVEGARNREKFTLGLIRNSFLNNFPFDWIKFAILKISWSFNDGSFGVWGEGSSNNHRIIFINNDKVSRIVRRVLSFNGDKFSIYKIFVSAIWFISLILLIIYLINPVKNNSISVILSSVVLAIITYQALFENRARYIFIFLPVFILGATLGADTILGFINRGSDEK